MIQPQSAQGTAGFFVFQGASRKRFVGQPVVEGNDVGPHGGMGHPGGPHKGRHKQKYRKGWFPFYQIDAHPPFFELHIAEFIEKTANCVPMRKWEISFYSYVMY